MKTSVAEFSPSMCHSQAVFKDEGHMGALVFGSFLGETIDFGNHVRAIVGVRAHNQRIVFRRQHEVPLKPQLCLLTHTLAPRRAEVNIIVPRHLAYEIAHRTYRQVIEVIAVERFPIRIVLLHIFSSVADDAQRPVDVDNCYFAIHTDNQIKRAASHEWLSN